MVKKRCHIGYCGKVSYMERGLCSVQARGLAKFIRSQHTCKCRHYRNPVHETQCKDDFLYRKCKGRTGISGIVFLAKLAAMKHIQIPHTSPLITPEEHRQSPNNNLLINLCLSFPYQTTCVCLISFQIATTI